MKLRLETVGLSFTSLAMAAAWLSRVTTSTLSAGLCLAETGDP